MKMKKIKKGVESALNSHSEHSNCIMPVFALECSGAFATPYFKR